MLIPGSGLVKLLVGLVLVSSIFGEWRLGRINGIYSNVSLNRYSMSFRTVKYVLYFNLLVSLFI